MNDDLITNRIFGEKNTVKIIIYLHIFGEKSRNEIYQAISTNPRMPIKLDLLEHYGIIKTVEGGTVTCKRLVSLTPLGRKYAEALANLEKCTGGSLDVFKWDLMRSMMDDMCRSEA